MAYVAFAWKIFGNSPVVARIAMSWIAAAALLGSYRVARLFTSPVRASAAVVVIALYPVLFLQSTLFQLDVAIAAVSVWAVYALLTGRFGYCVLLCCCAAGIKATGFVTGIACFTALLIDYYLVRPRLFPNITLGRLILYQLGLPLITTGAGMVLNYVVLNAAFGDLGILRYNLSSLASSPQRLLVAAVNRMWHLTGHMGLWALTASTALPALRLYRTWPSSNATLKKLCLLTASFTLVYGITFTLIGGAILARYVLPATLLLLTLGGVLASLFLARGFVLVIPFVISVFVVSLVVEPPYHTALEDGLMYQKFITLHQKAAQRLLADAPRQRVITTWPATDELSKPFLGYVDHPLSVVPVPDLKEPTVAEATATCPDCWVFVFNTEFVPARSGFRPGDLLRRFSPWARGQSEQRASETLATTDLKALQNYRLVERLNFGSNFGSIWAPIR